MYVCGLDCTGGEVQTDTLLSFIGNIMYNEMDEELSGCLMEVLLVSKP